MREYMRIGSYCGPITRLQGEPAFLTPIPLNANCVFAQFRNSELFPNPYSWHHLLVDEFDVFEIIPEYTTIIRGVATDFKVRLVLDGMRYGQGFELINEYSEPLVEFYDTRYLHTQFGQFVSRYFLSTMMETGPKTINGLTLDTGSDSWFLTPQGVLHTQYWLQGLILGLNLDPNMNTDLVIPK